ncbi:hypothetical protein JD969_01285 [Planctomycetota bacterium]|nr:hypothetical protein JD969_01285 [Planctomycetota bacterium]
MNQTQEQSDIDLSWLITDDLHCLGEGCNYNIRGLVGPHVKCPECGKINNLKNPAPWKEKTLPLGVKQREHWPAMAPASSFVLIFFLSLSIASIYSWTSDFITNNFANFTLSLFSVQVLLPLIITISTLVAWLYFCTSWLRSANWSKRAYGILIRTHLGSWCTFSGIVLGPAQCASAHGRQTFSPLLLIPFFTLFPLGLFLIIWTSKTLKANNQTQIAYREDWKTWALPLNYDADQTSKQSPTN